MFYYVHGSVISKCPYLSHILWTYASKTDVWRNKWMPWESIKMCSDSENCEINWGVWSSSMNTLFMNCSKYEHLSEYLYNCCVYSTLASFSKGAPSTWNHRIIHVSQNSSSWASQMIQNFSSSSLGSSCPCTWWLCLGICSSSWLSALTLTSTAPCTSSSPICPWLTSVSAPPPSLRC